MVSNLNSKHEKLILQDIEQDTVNAQQQNK